MTSPESHTGPGPLSLISVGGPTVILEVGGLRLVTDPTFDDPAEYPVGAGYSLVKTVGPAVVLDEVGQVDAVLLSHDQHADNLDVAGRALLKRAGRVFSTHAAAERLGSIVTALGPWDSASLPLPGGRELSVTALPALHGPTGCETVLGDVIGFMLTGEDLPTVYLSGDNASMEVVRSIRERVGKFDVGILHAGAARTPRLGGANLTLNGELAAEVTRELQLQRAVVVHVDGWQHFSEGAAEVARAFSSAGLGGQLILPQPGVRTEIA